MNLTGIICFQMHTDQMIRSKVLSNGRWKYGDTNDPAARQAYQSLIHVSKQHGDSLFKTGTVASAV